MSNTELIQLASKVIENLDFKFPYDAEQWINNGMVMENYHKHTTWSNLVQIDSATSIDDFIDLSKKYGCKCYFSGEHGYPGEWMNVYGICKNTGMKFIYSAEVYWVKDRLSFKVEEYTDKDGNLKTRERRDSTNCHMIIVARNYQAIRKLNYIITKAHEDGFYYKPRIDLDLLFTLSSEDVYVTSACIAGWKYEDATEIWYKVWKHFGDSFFLEYQPHSVEAQIELNKKIHSLSQSTGIKTIIGLDTHYINEEDMIKRNNLLLRKGIEYPEESGWQLDFPNGEEVFRRMRAQNIIPDEEILEAMMNTHVFVEGCEDITLYNDFKIPILSELHDLSYDERCDKLYEIIMKKYESEPQSQERLDGINYEFGEIKDSGTADYFISNYHLVNLAINKYGGQLTTTSRGSASSYYCSKLLGFTTMDRFDAEVPIYPERFITKDRVLSSHQMPDIDLNIAVQEPFVQAARELFGEQSCYPLLAVGKLGEKSGFKVYADVAGIEPSVANEITSMIDAYNEDRKNTEEEDSISIEDYIKDPKFLKIFNESKPYQGIIEQAKVHPCGFQLFNGDNVHTDWIGYGDIRYEFGLIRCHSESTGKSVLVVNAEGSLLDSNGYVKDDFLIVDVVSIINKLYSSIGMKVPTVTELRSMVTGDQKTWDLYAKGVTCCLNQCEKIGTTQKVKVYKPQNIKELAAFIAGIRPGFKSLINGFLSRVKYTNGEKAIDTLLEDCFHYMLYQEAVMKIFTYLGIPMKDSYDTIKKISKKKLKGEALQHVEDTLKEHWLANIGNLDNFETVYKVIKDSARYSFNAPHALAMANDSLYEAWFKAHHTSMFYEVTMNHYQGKGEKDKVSELQQEAMNMWGYKLGEFKFGSDNRKISVDDNSKIIYPNLATIKHINAIAAETLYTLGQKEYSSFFDVLIELENSPINSRQLDILIKLDYFKDYGDINLLLDQVEKFNALYGKKNINKEKLIKGLSVDIFRKYGLSETDKIIKVDNAGILSILKEHYTLTDIPKVTIKQRLDWQMEILDYIDYVDPECSNRLIYVTNLNTKYSPKFNAYSVKTGKYCELKVFKKKNRKDPDVTIFGQVPFEDGDLLIMDKCDKKPKKKWDGKDWVTIEGQFEWWLIKYRKST